MNLSPRWVGVLVQNAVGMNPALTIDGIQLSSYALVGSVAFSAGITHTISAAVIAVELTGIF